MGAAIGIEVFTSRVAAQLAGLTMPMIERWDVEGFISPSVLGAAGTGSRRVYSFRDVIALRVAAEVRRFGVNLKTAALFVRHLQERETLSATAPLASTLLVLHGDTVFEIDDSVPLAKAFPLISGSIVIPLHVLVREVQENARSLRRDPPTSKSENCHVRRAAARARAA